MGVMVMLQYFTKNRPNNIQIRSNLHTEYLCHLDKSASIMPRSMHSHNYVLEIILVISGIGKYIIDNQHIIARPGDILIINAEALHDETSLCELETYCLGLSNIQLPNKRPNQLIHDDFLPIIQSQHYFESLKQLFELIEITISRDDSLGIDYLNLLSSAIMVICEDILRHHNRTKPHLKYSLADKIKQYIDANYTDNINLTRIALDMNASEYYLSHIFKKLTSFSPLQYIIRRRIGEAQNLLINTNMSITEIATSIGYNNSNYFQNAFKKMIHITPGEYRRLWRKK